MSYESEMAKEIQAQERHYRRWPAHGEIYTEDDFRAGKKRKQQEESDCERGGVKKEPIEF